MIREAAHILDKACAHMVLSLMMQQLQAHLDTGLQRLHQELLTKRNAVVVQILNRGRHLQQVSGLSGSQRQQSGLHSNF